MQLEWLLKRFGRAFLSLAILTVIVFFCVRLLPGDAATAILGENATPQAVAVLRERMGLEAPIVVQFFYWLAASLTGDFGIATTLNQPVSAIVKSSFSTSLLLATVALLISVLIALPLGILAALRRGHRPDVAILSISYVGVSVPDFVIGPVLIILLSLPPIGLFPSSGFVPFTESPILSLHYLFLPTLTLVLSLLAHLVRQTRSGILDILNLDFVRTARLKGIPERSVLVRHVLPSALTATIAVIALDFGFLLGGIVVVEEIFAIPGLGRTMVYAVSNRDLPLVQACVLVIGIVYIGATLLSDVFQYIANPRMKQHG